MPTYLVDSLRWVVGELRIRETPLLANVSERNSSASGLFDNICVIICRTITVFSDSLQCGLELEHLLKSVPVHRQKVR